MSDRHLVTKKTLDDCHYFSTNDYEVTFYTQKALTTLKEVNEDSLLVQTFDGHLLLAVADGVGGSQDASKASSLILENISKKISDFGETNNYIHEIINIIQKTNELLRKNEIVSQTTLTLCLLHKNNLISIQIGDSGLILCGQRGLLKYKTHMHSPIGYAVESGLLDEIDALSHPDLHIVDNVIGFSGLRIEIGPKLLMHRYDSLFLASDGMFDNFITSEIIGLIKNGDIKKLSSKLTDYAKNHYNPYTKEAMQKDDDFTFILCRRKR